MKGVSGCQESHSFLCLILQPTTSGSRAASSSIAQRSLEQINSPTLAPGLFCPPNLLPLFRLPGFLQQLLPNNWQDFPCLVLFSLTPHTHSQPGSLTFLNKPSFLPLEWSSLVIHYTLTYKQYFFRVYLDKVTNYPLPFSKYVGPGVDHGCVKLMFRNPVQTEDRE